MIPANELFKQQLRDPTFKRWYDTRSPFIKQMAELYPYDAYIMRYESPYGIACAGQIVHLHSFLENNPDQVKVVVLGREKTEHCKAHEMVLYAQKDIAKRGITIQQIHASNVVVKVETKWLEPYEYETKTPHNNGHTKTG